MDVVFHTSAARPQPLTVGMFQKTDMSAWFNLFADLDPLADPDAVGRQPNENSGGGRL